MSSDFEETFQRIADKAYAFANRPRIPAKVPPRRRPGARKTHCKRGHERNAENLSPSSRACLICMAMMKHIWWIKQKALKAK